MKKVEGKLLDRSARSVRLSHLSPATRYLVCVLGLGQWILPPNTTGPFSDGFPQLNDSQTSRCTEELAPMLSSSDVETRRTVIGLPRHSYAAKDTRKSFMQGV
ncbi:hypothetical protein GE061_017952 [Apolygus lucorum]|uniref:Uncharacterized protein n=1 Tax=Apolygus lucorum TaxID=248454 RepID=A0A8S9XF54_APOLU|nr:hypothetical protein GE061_017952 [Apolygus lucorum]